MMVEMADSPSTRSVKISSDERTGWSSERPRRDGAPPRPVDISVKNRVLAPSDRLRYSPGSLLIVVGPAASEPVRFVERAVEERGAMLAPTKVRALLEGRVAADELDARAAELLTTAVRKRLEAGETVVVPLDGLDAGEREPYVRLAHGLRRPRHLILVDAPRDKVLDDERAVLDELRRALDAGELGLEGFQTALRLGGNTLAELKRIVFAPPPRDD
jgi:predicted kinase